MKTFFGAYRVNGHLFTFNIQARDMAGAVAFVEGSRPEAVWIESIKEVAKF